MFYDGLSSATVQTPATAWCAQLNVLNSVGVGFGSCPSRGDHNEVFLKTINSKQESHSQLKENKPEEEILVSC